MTSALYAATVVVLWITFGLVSGIVAGKRFFDDDVGAALAVALIPTTTFGATLGFAAAHCLAEWHAPLATRMLLPTVLLSVLASIATYALLDFVLVRLYPLLPPMSRQFWNNHAFALELAQSVLAGALGSSVGIAVSTRAPH
jgi:hypothetical protein